MTISKARIKANRKYNEKAYDRLAVSVYKGQRQQIADYAASIGMTVNGYINKLIAEDMGDKLTKPENDQ